MIIQHILLILLILLTFFITPVFSETAETIDTGNSSELIVVEQVSGPITFVSDIIKENWGGVCISVFSGKTEIKSSVDAGGGKEEVANGSNKYTGYAVTFENNRQNGFSWLIYPRFMNQRISITDFREEVRYIDAPDTQNIDYIVTDFETGYQVDPLDVNRYQININSAGFILKGMFQWNSEELFSAVKLFVNGHAGVGLAEVFDTEIELGQDISTGEKWYFGGSMDTGLSCGLMINSINTLIELKGGLAVYPRIELPEKAEFKYKYEYNADKNIYERKRLFLDEVELYMNTVCVSLTYFF